MNIYLDSLNNSIYLSKASAKKEQDVCFHMDFNYDISTVEGRDKAIQEFLAAEETSISRKDSNNTLIFSDETVAFGLFDLPKLSRFKINDVFLTRFKTSYPDFENYFLESFEYSKNTNGTLYFYTVARKTIYDNAISLFNNASIQIKKVDYFAHSLLSLANKKSEYPYARLIIGKKKSELIIFKGEKVISINCIDFGSEVLLDENTYISSPYYYNNQKAKKYAGFVKNTVKTQQEFNDSNIMATSEEDGFKVSKPKETRILKGTSLGVYNVKNNVKKLYALINDIIDKYSLDPWFMPIKEISAYASGEIVEMLNESTDDHSLTFVGEEFDSEAYISRDFANNGLYKTVVKKERRRIDWAKFFTMKIGKQKKD